MKKLCNVYVIKDMENVQRAVIELYMHLGGLLSTQEARVASHSAIASCDSYASFVLSNLPRAYITR